MTSLSERLRKGMFSNFFSQGSSIIIQFITIPLYLRCWGTEIYGQWLLIYAIPSYLSFIDLGFGITSATEIAKSLNKNNYKEALTIFQSTLFVTTFIGLSVFLLSFSLLFFNLKEFLNITYYSSIEVKTASFLLVLYVIVHQQTGIITGLYNYINKYHFITYYNSTFRLIEFILISIIVFLSKNILVLCVSILLLKMIQVIYLMVDVKRKFLWIRYGYKYKDLVYIKNFFLPSFSSLLYPISLSILNQGVALAIGKNIGPTSLVLFTTLRTITNLIKTFTQQYNNLMYSELVKYFAARNYKSAFFLFKRSILGSSLFIVLAGIGLIFIGPIFIDIWTKGKIGQISNMVILYFILEVFTYNLWHTLYQVYQAQNRHTKLSFYYLFFSIAVIVSINIIKSNNISQLYLVVTSLSNILLFIIFYDLNKKKVEYLKEELV